VSGTAGDRRVAADLLARIEKDPAVGARAERAYRGRHDLRDALWWAAHPGGTAPSGRPDPALELRRLRSAAFSREGQESEWVDVPLPSGGRGRVRRAEALALECETRLDRDRADLRALVAALAGLTAADAAVEAETAGGDTGENPGDGASWEPGGFAVSMGVDSGSASGSAAPLRRGMRRRGRGNVARGTSDGPPSTGSADGTPDGAADPADAPPRRVAALRSAVLRRPVTVTAALALVGLVAGAGITWAALSGTGRPTVGDPAASGSVVDTPSWDTPAQGAPPALEVFNRDPTAEDALPPEFFLDSPAATARILYTNGPLKVWGFLDRGQVCMFIQEGEAASGTCTARDSFGYAGITLMLSAEGTLMPDPKYGDPSTPITDLTWTPRGQIQIRSAPLGQD
jgi:hypothetical protein